VSLCQQVRHILKIQADSALKKPDFGTWLEALAVKCDSNQPIRTGKPDKIHAADSSGRK
jgi:hypothetical protein